MFKYYKHFKGGFYKLLVSARDCDNPEYIVEIYKALQKKEDFPNGQIWFRERAAFHGLRGDVKRMRKLSLTETILLLVGMRRFVK